MDFGCGHGEYTIALAYSDTSSTVYSIDTNKKMLKVVRDKLEKYNIKNVIPKENNFSNIPDISDNYADLILMYDVIFASDLKTKLPLRFGYYQEAKRILKPSGILSINLFEIGKTRDMCGKRKKYSTEKLIAEIEENGYKFKEKINGAIHFDYYHSEYHWKKCNGDMPFDYLEQGPVLNFYNKKE